MKLQGLETGNPEFIARRRRLVRALFFTAEFHEPVLQPASIFCQRASLFRHYRRGFGFLDRLYGQCRVGPKVSRNQRVFQLKKKLSQVLIYNYKRWGFHDRNVAIDHLEAPEGHRASKLSFLQKSATLNCVARALFSLFLMAATATRFIRFVAMRVFDQRV